MKIIIFKLLFAYIGIESARLTEASVLYGLLIGIIVGHILDHLATARFNRWRFGRFQKAHAQKVFQDEFLGSLFFMMGKICGSDGAIVEEEIAEVERVMEEVLKLSRKDKAKAIAAFRSARKSNATFQSMAVRFYEIYAAYPQMLEGTIQMFIRLATVDGHLSDDEEHLIHMAASVFGIDKKRYQQLALPFKGSASVSTSLEQSYAVLGCNPEDSVTDIKKSYRKLVSEFHPDKIHSKELPAEFMEFANQKMKEIQNAYDILKSERGFS